MGSSESDEPKQQGMFNPKGLTLIKEAVSGLVKSPSTLTEPARVFPTTLSLSNMKSRIDAALMICAGKDTSETETSQNARTNICSRPSTSRAGTLSNLGTKRDVKESSDYSSRNKPTLPPLKKAKAEIGSHLQGNSISKRSLRRGKCYTSTAGPTTYHANGTENVPGQPTSTVIGSCNPVSTPYIKTEVVEELQMATVAYEASLPSHPLPLTPSYTSTPKSTPEVTSVKLETAVTTSRLWNISPKVYEDLKNITFRHFYEPL